MKRILRIAQCTCGALYPTLNYLGICESCQTVSYRHISLCHLEFRQMQLFRMTLFSGTLHRDALLQELWPNPDDEPELPENLIRVWASRISKLIFPFAVIGINKAYFIGLQDGVHHPDWLQRPGKQRGIKRVYDFGGRGMIALRYPELLQAGA